MIVCQAEEGSKQSTTALQAVQQEADKQKQAVATAQAMCKKVRLSPPQAPCNISIPAALPVIAAACWVIAVY